MTATSTPPDLGSILAVFAHPDDEAYIVGGLMAAAVDAGRRVVCVTATRGELGFPDDDARSPAERTAVRERELAGCLAELGVTEHHWMGYADGGCEAVDDDEPVAALVGLLEAVEPDTVVTFGPDGDTGHPDHVAVSRWTTLAVRAHGGSARLLYGAMTPEWVGEVTAFVAPEEYMMRGDAIPSTPAEELAVHVVWDDDAVARKVRALQRQPSQTAGLIDQVGMEAYVRLNRHEMLRDPRPGDWPER